MSLLPPQNHVNPAMDFTQTPPGMLALDNMLYLAKGHQDTYIRVSSQETSLITGAGPHSAAHSQEANLAKELAIKGSS